ncbi:MAG: DUF222 domain-containing protein [Microthrixaceae bacterium]
MLVMEIHQEVVAQREALASLVRRLDPDDLPASQAPALWRELDVMGRQIAAAKVLVARRVEDSHRWKGEGFASPAEYLAAKGGTSLAAARTELEMSKALPSLPAVRAALVEGEVSPQQGALIADAAKANPAAERSLLASARKDSFRELKDHAQRAKAAADPNPEATQRRIHDGRRLAEFIDAEGAWNLHARGTVADGAKFHAVLEPLIEARFRANRSEGRRESAEANAFDALVELAGRPDAGPGRAGRYLGLIRCDLTALQRGRTHGDEVCEVAGLGPVPVATAVDLLGDATWKLVITRGTDVANVTTLSRKATAAMVAALAWRSPTCSVEGCGRTILQIDHRIPWAQTRHTTLCELDPICPHHHDRKTHDGWELVVGAGTRAMVPPDHPLHPSRGAAPRGDPP